MFRSFVLLCLFSISCLMSQTISTFEGTDSKAGWMAKDNVQLAVTNSGDTSRKNALRANVSFEKVAYSWIRKANFKAGDLDLTKQGGVSFWIRAEKPVSIGAALTYVDGDKKEIRFGSGFVATDKWTEVKLPFGNFKAEKGGTVMTADEAKKCIWFTLSANKKESATTVIWLDDLSFMAK